MTKPLESIRLTYMIETPGSPAKLAEKIASDQSTGTFVALPGETEELKNRVAARIGGIAGASASGHTILSSQRARSVQSR